MCVCACVCVCVWVHACMYACVHACVSVCMCVSVHMSMCSSVRTGLDAKLTRGSEVELLQWLNHCLLVLLSSRRHSRKTRFAVSLLCWQGGLKCRCVAWRRWFPWKFASCCLCHNKWAFFWIFYITGWPPEAWRHWTCLERLPRIPPLMAAATDRGVWPDLPLEGGEGQLGAVSADRKGTRGHLHIFRRPLFAENEMILF